MTPGARELPLPPSTPAHTEKALFEILITLSAALQGTLFLANDTFVVRFREVAVNSLMPAGQSGFSRPSPGS